MKNKTILIVGGCSLDNCILTNQLSENNNIVVIDKLSTGCIYTMNDDVSVYKEDIRNAKRVNDVLSEHKIDFILDFVTSKYKLNTYR